MVLRSTLNRVKIIVFPFVLLMTSLHITAQGQMASYVAWKPDGSMLAIGSGSTVQILNAATLQTLNTFTGLAEQVTAPSWSSDGNRLAIANGRSVQVWQNPWNASPQLITTFTYNVGYINSIAWSPGSDRIASVNGSVTTVWNPTNSQIIYSVESHRDYVFDVTWSPDGSQFITTSIDRTIKLWNAANGTLLSTMLMVTSFSLPVPDDRASVFSPSWNSDGTKLVIGASDSTVRILDRVSFNSAEAMSTGNDINVLKGHAGPVWSVDWRPTSNQVASGGEDGTVRIWNSTTGEQLQTIQVGHSVVSLAWSPDGSKIAYGGESGTVQITPVSGDPTPTATPTPTPTPSYNCPCNIFGSTVPANPSWNDSSAVTLGMRFRSSVAGQVTGVRFYKGTGNTGTHTGQLWSNTGTLLGSVTFSGETSSGWQQATFSTPINISANTTYVVSYHAPVGRYSVDRPALVSAVNNPPLKALADDEDGANGVYRYGASGLFPNTAPTTSTNYWVDVIFVPAS
jgi:WD40 repeat protein